MEANRTLRIIANLAVSADGKLDSAYREGAGFSSRLDRDRMDALRAEADALLVGAATIRNEDPPLRVRDPGRIAARAAAGRAEQLIVLAVSSRGAIPPTARFLREPAAARILATGADPDPEALRALAAPLADGTLEHWRSRGEQVDPLVLCEELERRGVRTLLVEGGGETLAAFVEADLLDTIYLTICPLIVGGREAPTPVEGVGLRWAEARRLRLISAEHIGEELFLRYERANASS